MTERVHDLKHDGAQLGGKPGSDLSQTLLRPFLAELSRYWWIELVAGVFWVVVALVVLKFNHASVVTVGLLTGIMFLIFAAEMLALSVLDPGATKWLWAFFGALLTAAGIVALLHPRRTFAGFADILGFVFLLIGLIWTCQAFAERVFNPLWWLSLMSGILMIVLAFWVSGEFFLDRAVTLLVFAGVWALMKGITDLVRAFQLRSLAPSRSDALSGAEKRQAESRLKPAGPGY